MAVRLTMDIFSGLPNPSVVLDDAEGPEIIARLRKATKSRPGAGTPMRSVPSLGYRGILVEQLGNATEKSLPATFRVFDGSVMTSAGRWPLADPSIEDILCSNAGPFRRASGMEAVFRSLEIARSQLTSSAPAEPKRSGSVPSPVRCRLAPRYEPEWWNDGTAPASRQQRNNCYNYATNHRTDTFARPGVGSGRTYPFPTRCKDVYAATLRDGLVEVPISEINKCPDEGHLVALVISPMIDFHFYRKGRDGFWSHKPGINPATNLDQDGKPIVDPRFASRGVYSEFCGLLLVLPGHIVIR